METRGKIYVLIEIGRHVGNKSIVKIARQSITSDIVKHEIRHAWIFTAAGFASCMFYYIFFPKDQDIEYGGVTYGLGKVSFLKRELVTAAQALFDIFDIFRLAFKIGAKVFISCLNIPIYFLASSIPFPPSDADISRGYFNYLKREFNDHYPGHSFCKSKVIYLKINQKKKLKFSTLLAQKRA